MNQINENENKGFSLVELIVVIAIMAVLTAVLAPSLLGYVENSRAQKDDSAMAEIANVVKLAMTDQEIYDECFKMTAKTNFSCYADSGKSDDMKVIDKAENTAKGIKEQWHYNDLARVVDEELYTADGNMRGLTITFKPAAADSTEILFAKAQVNNITNASFASDATNTPTDEQKGDFSAKLGKLCTKVSDELGNAMTINSQTYRNSEYTVFVRMGTSGETISVYGQWNGTNTITRATAPGSGSGTPGGGGEGQGT